MKFASLGANIQAEPDQERLKKAREREIIRNKAAGVRVKKEKEFKKKDTISKPEVIVDHKNRKYVKAPTTDKLHRIKRLTRGERKHRKTTVS